MSISTADCLQLLERSLFWSATVVGTHPNFDITNPGSTTQYFQQQQIPTQIKQLDQPSACRAVTIHHQQQLLMFCCSWLATTAESDTLAKYQQLQQQPLGTLLFSVAQSWRRSTFEYSQTTIASQQGSLKAVARRSDFLNANHERLHLIEFFL